MADLRSMHDDPQENDIVARLRRGAKMPTPPVMWLSEAADEITRLRRRVADLEYEIKESRHDGPSERHPEWSV